jgi:hypothetical protein
VCHSLTPASAGSKGIWERDEFSIPTCPYDSVLREVDRDTDTVAHPTSSPPTNNYVCVLGTLILAIRATLARQKETDCRQYFLLFHWTKWRGRSDVKFLHDSFSQFLFNVPYW